MEDFKKNIENVFSLARVQITNSNPNDEALLIHVIKLKAELFKKLDKVPQEKESKK